ncbi:MAG: hypothetical protein IIA06_02925, partial [Proteobacteria bacterium]|nr:hypothetical protein [Pseudomonadota bacterium]
MAKQRKLIKNFRLVNTIEYYKDINVPNDAGLEDRPALCEILKKIRVETKKKAVKKDQGEAEGQETKKEGKPKAKKEEKAEEKKEETKEEIKKVLAELNLTEEEVIQSYVNYDMDVFAYKNEI